MEEKIKEIIKKHLKEDGRGLMDLEYAENNDLLKKTDLYKSYEDIWKEAQDDFKKRLLKTKVMKRGKLDGNQWHKEVCMELEELSNN